MAKCDGPKSCAGVMAVLADETRLRIVRVLLPGKQCVKDLAEAIGLTEARVSHHLAILRRSGIAEAERDGQRVFYYLNPELRLKGSAAGLDLGCCALSFRPLLKDGCCNG
jgi:ArsR family transcriptional regulator, nickel/cobalt-responsive transcriptional repressor